MKGKRSIAVDEQYGRSTPNGETDKKLHVIASGIFDQRWRLQRTQYVREELIVIQ